jgi:hypothetical protein
MTELDFILTEETGYVLRKASKPSSDSFTIIEPYQAIMAKELKEQFDYLVDDYAQAIGYPRNSGDKPIFRKNLESILLGFIASISKNQWLGIFGGKDTYKCKETTFHLTYAYTTKILNFLLYDFHVIEKLSGALDRSDTDSKGFRRVNKYWPTEGLRADLMPFIYCIEVPFTGSSVCINYPKEPGKLKRCRLRNKTFDTDRRNLNIINNYLKQQQYPIKSPIKRIYTEDTLHGGRLYGAFQGIPANRLKLRQTLMINASTMIEVDYKSNHLNMAIALFEDSSKRIYDPLTLLSPALPNSKFADVRGLFKGYVVRLINGSSEHGFKKSFNKMIDTELKKSDYDNFLLFEFSEAFDLLLKLFKSNFPNIPLFEKLGSKLQKLEGDIMMEILLESVKREITVLPLHDACLCESENITAVKEMMERHWSSVLNTDIKPVVEVK